MSLRAPRLLKIVVACGATAWIGDGCTPGHDLVITNARMIDGTGAPPVTDVSIVVSDGRIEAVTRERVNVGNATVIDAAGSTVLPGLADLHVHSTVEYWTDPDQPGSMEDSGPAITTEGDLQDFGAERLPDRLRAFLEAGVTTIVDPGGFWPFVVEVRDRVASGELLGPRMFVVGPVFTSPGTHPASTVCFNEPWCVERLTCATDDAQVARQCVRGLAASGVDGLKLVYGPEVGVSRDVSEAIIDEGRRHGLPVGGHVESLDLMAEAAKAGVELLVHAPRARLGMLTTSDGEDLPTLLGGLGVPVTTTVRFDDPRDVPEARRDQTVEWLETGLGPGMRALQAAGVTLLFGTDFQGIGNPAQPRERVLSEIHVLRLAGFSNAEIIQAMTGDAVVHPMTPDDIGTIEPGKVADLIIVDDDPLTNIESIVHPRVVIKDGRIVVDQR